MGELDEFMDKMTKTAEKEHGRDFFEAVVHCITKSVWKR
jgi:hypothetical protein